MMPDPAADDEAKSAVDLIVWDQPFNERGRSWFRTAIAQAPNGELFAKDVRAFSHGCIRLERPVELAQWVLGWNEGRVQRVLAHYERQSDSEAVADDEAAYRSTTATVMNIPVKLVPAVRALLAKRRAS